MPKPQTWVKALYNASRAGDLSPLPCLVMIFPLAVLTAQLGCIAAPVYSLMALLHLPLFHVMRTTNTPWGKPVTCKLSALAGKAWRESNIPLIENTSTTALAGSDERLNTPLYALSWMPLADAEGATMPVEGPFQACS